jgi:hypothetical protein
VLLSWTQTGWESPYNKRTKHWVRKSRKVSRCNRSKPRSSGHYQIYFLFNSEWESTEIKLTLHKALNMFARTSACPAWEFPAKTCLLKSRNAYKRRFSADLATFLRAHRFTTCNAFQPTVCLSPRHTTMHKWPEVIQNHQNEHAHKQKPDTHSVTGLNLAAGKLRADQVIRRRCCISYVS